MNWWDEALFDTCSLITVDKMLLDDPAMCRFFPHMRTIEICLDRDNMRPSTAERIRPLATAVDLPELSVVLHTTAGLSAALSEIDKVLFATALVSRHPVVTGDRSLGKALVRSDIRVADFALIIRELVQHRRISARRCDRILAGLAARDDHIIPCPQSWENLKHHRFP